MPLAEVCDHRMRPVIEGNNRSADRILDSKEATQWRRWEILGASIRLLPTRPHHRGAGLRRRVAAVIAISEASGQSQSMVLPKS